MGSALTAMLTAAARSHAPWRCSGARELVADAAVAGGWQIVGGALRRTGPEPLVIGIVADAGGSDPKTIAALTQLRTAFQSHGANLVLTLGGMGATRAELAATLTAVSGAWPVVAIPGDLEPIPAHQAAIADVRGSGSIALDGRSLRTIEAKNVLIGIIPGVGSEYRAVAGSDGCTWVAGDIADAFRQWSAFPGLRIAVSAEAPRETIDGEATGEIALVPEDPIDVLVHGPTRAIPSSPIRGGRDGTRVALSPGTVDATARLPPIRGTTAGVLVVRDLTWEWSPILGSP